MITRDDLIVSDRPNSRFYYTVVVQKGEGDEQWIWADEVDDVSDKALDRLVAAANKAWSNRITNPTVMLSHTVAFHVGEPDATVRITEE